MPECVKSNLSCRKTHIALHFAMPSCPHAEIPVNVITSLSNPKIKDAVKLREGKHRRQAGKFLIDGERELRRAVQAGIPILELFTVHPPSSVPSCFYEETTRIRQVTEPVFRKIAYGDREDGIVAVAEEPVLTFDRFEAKIKQKGDPLLAVVEKISKPGNLGAVFRSADAAGFDGVMIADLHLDPFHYNSIRSSLGTVFHVPTVSESSAMICQWLKDQGIQIAAAWCGGKTLPYTAIDFCRPTAIVLGSEAEGLSGVWSGEGITGVTLPMQGIADSLNVSVAAGILFYEARRQRCSSPPKGG